MNLSFSMVYVSSYQRSIYFNCVDNCYTFTHTLNSTHCKSPLLYETKSYNQEIIWNVQPRFMYGSIRKMKVTHTLGQFNKWDILQETQCSFTKSTCYELWSSSLKDLIEREAATISVLTYYVYYFCIYAIIIHRSAFCFTEPILYVVHTLHSTCGSHESPAALLFSADCSNQSP